LHDRRIDSFQNTLQPMPMVDYNVIPKNSPYKIRLREVPQAPGSNPSTMRVRFFTFLLTAINATATTIQLDFKESQPFKIGDVIQVDVEKMLITDISGESVIVIRGYDSTIATSHTAESGANPTLAYGHDLEEVSSFPQPGQYWPDYATTPQDIKDWNTGSVMFNASDALKFMEISYMGTGCLNSAERSGNDPLRNYGYDPETDIVAILSGTVNLPSNVEGQIVYIREGVTVRPAYPGLLVRATGAVVMSGTVSANALIPANTWGNGGGAGGYNSDGAVATYSGFYSSIAIVSNGETPDIDKQNALLKAHGAYPLICGASGTAGSLAAGAGGGGVTFISPYIYFSGSILANANGGTSGSLNSSWGSAGGGGGGGAIIFIGERITNTGTFDVAGGAGASFRKTQGSDAGTRYSQAGGAGWVRLIEFGG
jgi:hypothetical protein